MRTRVVLVLVTLLAVGLSGCIGSDDPSEPDPGAPPSPGGIDHAAIAELIGAPIEVEHDHLDPALHTGSHNMRFLSWNTLDVELGTNGFANFVFYEDDDEKLAFVAVDGDSTGGFAIVDISDPFNVSTLGHYWIEGNSVQEVRVFPGGNYALMNVQDIPDPQRLATPDPSDCSVCLHVVDISDRANPQLESVLPVDLLGSHNMHIEEYDDGAYVFYVGQPLSNAPPGNYVGIARFVEHPGGAELVKVGEWRYEEAAQSEGRSFPHDVLVQEHPGTGQRIAYVSHWNDGLILVDVTDPLNPQDLGVYQDPAPSDVIQLHWAMQEPVERPDGRVIVWTAPEIGGLDTGSGVIRAIDVADPTQPTQVGAWELPGDVTIPGRYIFSGHTAVPDAGTGLLAVSHYHAGVWVLDITDPTDPRHLGYYLPHGDPTDPYDGPLWWKKPNFSPDGYGPNVYQARWDGDVLWVTDRGTGLYAFEYTGPVPGALLD